MRKFVIFFTGSEGTSPLVRLLDSFDRISILHQEGGAGWEPFDRHECGPMPDRDLRKCLDMVLCRGEIDFSELNRIYTKTAPDSLKATGSPAVVGFKMRFKFPGNSLLHIPGLDSWNEWASRRFRRQRRNAFKKMIMGLLKSNSPVVFFAIRRDLLRRSLSRYHGDGTCRPGHMQFDLACGKIRREDIGKIHVDCDRLERFILNSGQILREKLRLLEEFRANGISAFPLFYEDFVADKTSYFRRFFKILEMEVSEQEVAAALERGSYYQKVHSDDISEFVINYQEVMDRFGAAGISPLIRDLKFRTEE